MPDQFAIGVDYGTNSVRALVVDVADGAEIATARVSTTPAAKRGFCSTPKDPNLARQNPADYIEGFLSLGAKAVVAASKRQARIRCRAGRRHRRRHDRLDADSGRRRQGVPLAMQAGFDDNLAAHAWLWKDHTSHAEADGDHRTRQAAGRALPGQVRRHLLVANGTGRRSCTACGPRPKVAAAAAYAWVELADFVPAYVTGNTDPEHARPRHLRRRSQGDVPRPVGRAARAKTSSTRSSRGSVARCRYATEAVASDQQGGRADRRGGRRRSACRPGIPVAVGAFDAHMGAVGAGCRHGHAGEDHGHQHLRLHGRPAAQDDCPTSPACAASCPSRSCRACTASRRASRPWATSSTGSSSNSPRPSIRQRRRRTRQADRRCRRSSSRARAGLLALDWNNGNRTILVDPLLTGLLVGQTLHTTAAEIYRALVEATAFGALTIINRFEEYGVQGRRRWSTAAASPRRTPSSCRSTPTSAIGR